MAFSRLSVSLIAFHLMTSHFQRHLTETERLELQTDLDLLDSETGWTSILHQLALGPFAGAFCAGPGATVFVAFGAAGLALAVVIVGMVIGSVIGVWKTCQECRETKIRKQALRKDLELGLSEGWAVEASDAVEVSGEGFGFVFDVGQGDLLWLTPAASPVTVRCFQSAL